MGLRPGLYGLWGTPSIMVHVEMSIPHTGFCLQVYTMPEYLQKRYGGQRIRVYLSVLTILLYVTTKISADIYAGAIFIEQTLRWDLYVSVVILLIISAIFTVSGGLNAVIWTDFVQCVIMLAGSLTLLVVAMIKVDGYHSLMERFPQVRPKERWENTSSCAEVPKDFLHLLRSADDPEVRTAKTHMT
ncbi:hypothetical protein RvY_13004-2 [Ramazzottius varieornatus]|uniref:Uncharacterized protein n=1 Tax=Ramazzottius varieornatus TaxID=947166 RepID=A0A1D1VLE6_RAMVA|nr:hypothetical protein RvY_13004-2 [Ramazzottius varieornatus]